MILSGGSADIGVEWCWAPRCFVLMLLLSCSSSMFRIICSVSFFFFHDFGLLNVGVGFFGYVVDDCADSRDETFP